MDMCWFFNILQLQINFGPVTKNIFRFFPILLVNDILPRYLVLNVENIVY